MVFRKTHSKLKEQMKTKINNENKAKFFALYWGQEILSNGIEIGANVGEMVNAGWIRLTEQ